MWLALGLTTASGQVATPPLNAQLFRPSLDSRYTLWTNDSTRQPGRTLLARVALGYTRDPLTFYGSDGSITRVISDIVQADLVGGYQLGPLRFGLQAPIFLYSDGANRPSLSGFGDLALDIKSTLVQRENAPVGVALLTRLSFPTGSIVGLSSGGQTLEIEAIIDQEVGEKVFVAINTGARFLPDAGVPTWTNNVYGRFGVGYRSTQMSGLSAELISHGVTSRGGPSEVLVGGWGRAAVGLHMRGGIGTALGRGIGTPQLRMLFALAFEPTFEPDRDHDGLSDFDDKCPTVAEDSDGVEDHDGCPEPTKVTVRLNGADGEPIPDGHFVFEPAGTEGDTGDTAELYGGTYTLRATAEGYQAVERAVAVRDVATQAIDIQLTATPKAAVPHSRVSTEED